MKPFTLIAAAGALILVAAHDRARSAENAHLRSAAEQAQIETRRSAQTLSEIALRLEQLETACPSAVPPAPAPVTWQLPSVQPPSVSAPVASAPKTQEPSFLTLNSIPPSRVELDGHELGHTPQVHVSVKPGHHLARFVVTPGVLEKVVSVDVRPGETVLATANIQPQDGF